jgi:hypothetical protein
MDESGNSTKPTANIDAGAPHDDRMDAVDVTEGDAEKPRVYSVVKPQDRRAFLAALSKGAAVGASAIAASGCDDKCPSQPSTTSTTTTSTTTATTTTVPATFTVAGVVADKSGKPVVGARVFVVDGPNANKSSTTDGNGYYSIPGIVAGSFTLRVTFNAVFLYDIGVTIVRDTRLDLSVTTTTSSTSTVRPTTSTVGPSTSTVCGSYYSHYWYPN